MTFLITIPGIQNAVAPFFTPTPLTQKWVDEGGLDAASMTTVDRVMDAFIKVSENKDLNGVAVRVLPPRDIAMNDKGRVKGYPGWGAQNYYPALERGIVGKGQQRESKL